MSSLIKPYNPYAIHLNNNKDIISSGYAVNELIFWTTSILAYILFPSSITRSAKSSFISANYKHSFPTLPFIITTLSLGAFSLDYEALIIHSLSAMLINSELSNITLNDARNNIFKVLQVISYNFIEPDNVSIFKGFASSVSEERKKILNYSLSRWINNFIGPDREIDIVYDRVQKIANLNFTEYKENFYNLISITEYLLNVYSTYFFNCTDGEYFISSYGVPMMLYFLRNSQTIKFNKQNIYHQINSLYELSTTYRNLSYSLYFYIYNLFEVFTIDTGNRHYHLYDLLLSAHNYYEEKYETQLLTLKELHTILGIHNINITSLWYMMMGMWHIFTASKYTSEIFQDIFEYIRISLDIRPKALNIIVKGETTANQYYLKKLKNHYKDNLNLDIAVNAHSNKLENIYNLNKNDLSNLVLMIKGISLRGLILDESASIFENFIETLFEEIYSQEENYDSIEAQYTHDEYISNEIYKYIKLPRFYFEKNCIIQFYLSKPFKYLKNVILEFNYHDRSLINRRSEYDTSDLKYDFLCFGYQILDILNILSLNNAINSSIQDINNKSYARINILRAKVNTSYLYNKGLLGSISKIPLETAIIESGGISIINLLRYNDTNRCTSYLGWIPQIISSSTPFSLLTITYDYSSIWQILATLIYKNIGENANIVIPISYYYEILKSIPECKICFRGSQEGIKLSFDIKEFIFGRHYRYIEELKKCINFKNLLTTENAYLIHFIDKHLESSPLMYFIDLLLDESFNFSFISESEALAQIDLFTSVTRKGKFYNKFFDDLNVIREDPIYEISTRNMFNIEEYLHIISTLVYFEYGGLLPHILNFDIYYKYSTSKILSFNLLDKLITSASSCLWFMMKTNNLKRNNLRKNYFNFNQNNIIPYTSLRNIYYKFLPNNFQPPIYNYIDENNIQKTLTKEIYIFFTTIGLLVNDSFYKKSNRRILQEDINKTLPKTGIFIIKRLYDTKINSEGKILLSSNEYNLSYELCLGLNKNFIGFDLMYIIQNMLVSNMLFSVASVLKFIPNFNLINNKSLDLLNTVVTVINLFIPSFIGSIIRTGHKRKNFINFYERNNERDSIKRYSIIMSNTIYHDNSPLGLMSNPFQFNNPRYALKSIALLIASTFNAVAEYKEFESIKYVSGSEIIAKSSVTLMFKFLFNAFFNWLMPIKSITQFIFNIKSITNIFTTKKVKIKKRNKKDNLSINIPTQEEEDSIEDDMITKEDVIELLKDSN